MIRMISGTYGGAAGNKTAKDAPFSLTDAEEARLVQRGVAEYVYEQTQQSVEHENDGEVTLPEYDLSMTEKQLRGLAAYYGLDVSKVKGKKNIIAALDEHLKDENAEETDGDDPEETEAEEENADPDAPVLGAEDPEA